MAKSDVVSSGQENLSADHHHHLVCWRAIAAGVLVTVMGFLMLMTLGAGIAGYTADAVLERADGDFALASGAGLWLGLSALAALFCGSYFTLRIARFQTNKVGAAHGFVLASIFFLLMMGGVGSAIGGAAGGLSKGFGKLASGAGTGASDLSSNPVVQDLVNKAVGASKLKNDPREVAQGLVVRLVRGDIESVKSYLSYQTDISQAEVEQKAAQLKGEFDEAVKTTGQMAARALGHTGLSLFVFLLVGYVAAVVGGRVGAHANVDRPFARVGQRGSVLPYVFGWLLGVPVSLLALIALARAIF